MIVWQNKHVHRLRPEFACVVGICPYELFVLKTSVYVLGFTGWLAQICDENPRMGHFRCGF